MNIDQHTGRDFSIYCSLYCNSCEQVVIESYLSDRVGGTATQNAPFEVNVRAVLAFMDIGCGFSAMKEWSSDMNFPRVGNKS